MPSKITIPAGTVYGGLTVLSEDPVRTTDSRIKWICQCECGVMLSVRSRSLLRGQTSCGCRAREQLRLRSTTHGFTAGKYADHAPEFAAWNTMHERCKNPKHNRYHCYGGRGITVCPEWSDFARFIADMGRRPSPNHSIDRINNDLGYSRENCRWSTRKEQARNMSRNHWLTFEGQTLTMVEWAERMSLPYKCLKHRIYAGWNVGDALTTPSKKRVPSAQMHQERLPGT